MTTAEARSNVGIFGYLIANGNDYPKYLYGRITDVDRTYLEFTDNNKFIHLFKTAKVVSFEPRAFRSIKWKMPKVFLLKNN